MSVIDEVLAEAEETIEQRRQAAIADYLYDKSQDKYWDLVTRQLYPSKAVDASVPREAWPLVVRQVRDPETGNMMPREVRIKPSEAIMRIESDQFVETSTWWPGQPSIIKDKFIDGAGARTIPGVRLYNTYTPPDPVPWNNVDPQPFIDHVKLLFPDPAVHEYFFDYMAHTVQRPDVKINTAIVIAGSPKIGKDSLLEPIKRAVGLHNCNDIDPDDLFSPYKPWLQSVMLCINEVRSTKEEYHATSMHNILKPLIAAPPESLALNDKYRNMRYVRNHMRVVMTTNEWLSLYIPPEDRRMFVMLSPMPKDWHVEAGRANYFSEYWRWLEMGGYEAIANWLIGRPIDRFDPKAESPKTDAWHQIVGSWSLSECVVERAVDHLVIDGKRPRCVLGCELLSMNFEDDEEKTSLKNIMKSSRKLVHRMNNLGYQLVSCPGTEWKWAHDGVKVRSKVAFIRRDLRLFGDAAEMEVDRHGAKLAAKAAAPVKKSEAF